MAENKEEALKNTAPKTYTYADLLKFENPEIYSSIGKMRTSEKITAPKYGFGSANRDQQSKVYQSKDQIKTQFWGKNSPGPAYEVRGADKFDYHKDPEWKIGTEPRNTLNTGAKFDFYLRKDVDFNPDEADKFRRNHQPEFKIGGDQRFPVQNRHKDTPGPQYQPGLRPEIPNSVKSSFGFRREIQGQSILVANSSTPKIVGPGSYLAKEVPKTSVIPEDPHWSIGKGPKLQRVFPGWDKNQTYDTKSVSMGPQYNSKKQSMPAFRIGKETREAKTGHFKDMMATHNTKVRIQHPKY